MLEIIEIELPETFLKREDHIVGWLVGWLGGPLCRQSESLVNYEQV